MAIMASQQYVDRKFEEIKRILALEGVDKGPKRGLVLLRGVKFKDHPVLGDLNLDFCNGEGNPVDTVIIAGENGTGKSTILNVLNYVLSQDGNPRNVEFDLDLQVEGGRRFMQYAKQGYAVKGIVKDENDQRVKCDEFWGTRTVFSDVDINFHGKDISSVTSLDFDSGANSIRSSNSLATEIKQLIVDIQALDEATTANSIRHVLEVLSKFEYPLKTIDQFVSDEGDLMGNSNVLPFANDYSHGAFQNNQVSIDPIIVSVCKTVVNYVQKRYPGQIAAVRKTICRILRL